MFRKLLVLLPFMHYFFSFVLTFYAYKFSPECTLLQAVSSCDLYFGYKSLYKYSFFMNFQSVIDFMIMVIFYEPTQLLSVYLPGKMISIEILDQTRWTCVQKVNYQKNLWYACSSIFCSAINMQLTFPGYLHESHKPNFIYFFFLLFQALQS